MPGAYTLVLLGSTFLLSALWAAVLMVLVRLRETDSGDRTPLGVELAWAVIPALIVLAIVVPALQSGWTPSTDGGDRMAEVQPAP